MYTSILELKNKKFKGTLDIETLKMIQDDLLKLDIKTTIPNIFVKISQLDMTYISSFVLKSLVKVDETVEKEFLDIYLADEYDDLEKIDKFNSIFLYVNDLMKKCLPKANKNKEESIFEDDYLLYEDKDWELDAMEYTWNSIIGRTDNFLEITPRNYFEQVDIYKKFNNIKTEEVETF